MSSLLGCSALRNSIKAAATLTLTAAVSARFENSDSSSGFSSIKTYAPSSFTRTWTREATSTPYEIANTVPAAGKFRLVNYCCCWKCQWTTIVRSVAAAIQTGNIISDATFDAPWSRTEIAFTGDPPSTTTGTSGITGQVLFDFPPDSPPKYCMSDTEAGRVPATARFFLSGITGISNSSQSAMSWSYTDSKGGSDTGGPTSTLALPTSGSLSHSPIDGCEALPSGWVQIDFSGDASAGSVTDTTAASLRLEFAFS